MKLFDPSQQFKHRFTHDFETRSDVDITTHGMYRSQAAKGFKILMMSYAMDDEPVRLVECPNGQLPRWYFNEVLFDPTVLKTAYNAPFEIGAVEAEYGIRVDITQWQCTKVMAMMAGYASNLGETAKSMHLDVLKQTRGKQLIKIFSNPAEEKHFKKNGNNYWNLPEYFPREWNEFGDYCIQDSVVERAILTHPTVADMPLITEAERRYWLMDQRINRRGVKVDKELVDMVLDMYNEHTEKLIREGTMLTGLANFNSRDQLLAWLNSNDCIIKSLARDNVMEKLGHPGLANNLKRVLELRLETSKTSMGKYLLMHNMAGPKSRVYGCFQHYGANRTGRVSSPGLNLVNMVKNKLKYEPLEHLRELIRHRCPKAINRFYGPLSKVFSEATRSMFIPEEGFKFGVSDFASIESRVAAWFCGAEWKLQAFREGKDIYLVNAEAMYKIPYAELASHVGGKHPLREPAKVGELLCIAEDEMVLTDKGLKPIQNVSKFDKVWDGLHWVCTEGAIFKGTKKILYYGGLKATAEHLVWTEGSVGAIPFGLAAARGSRLLQTGDGGRNIRMGDDYLIREKMDQRVALPVRSNRMQRVQKGKLDALRKSSLREIARLSSVLQTATSTVVVKSKNQGCKIQMQQSKRQRLPQLRRPRRRVPVRVLLGIRPLSAQRSTRCKTVLGVRSYQQQWSLRKGKYSFCSSNTKSDKQAYDRYTGLGSRMLAIQLKRSSSAKKQRFFKSSNIKSCTRSCEKQVQELARDCGEVRVFDLLNCGPNNRFTVSNVLVHNCGYGGGEQAMINGGALKSGLLKQKELPAIKRNWRKANPEILAAWKEIDDAMKAAIDDPGLIVPCLNGKLKYMMQHGNLLCKLPSGRCLCYVRAVRKKVLRINKEYAPWRVLEWCAKEMPEVVIPDAFRTAFKYDKGKALERTVKDWQSYVEKYFGEEFPFFVIDQFCSKQKEFDSIQYEGMQETGSGRRWGTTDTYGPKGLENAVQAASRDIIYNAMENLENEGIPVVIHVYDETVNEIPEEDDVERINEIMERPVWWAPDLPLKAEGFETDFYMKE